MYWNQYTFLHVLVEHGSSLVCNSCDKDLIGFGGVGVNECQTDQNFFKLKTLRKYIVIFDNFFFQQVNLLTTLLFT